MNDRERDTERITLSEAEIADIGMAQDLYNASPDAQRHTAEVLAKFPDVTIEISGEWPEGQG